MQTEANTEIQIWRVENSGFHGKFKALMEEEDRIVPQRLLKEGCYLVVAHPEPPRFDCWAVNMATESLEAEFVLLATKAGMALSPPLGTSPFDHWLRCLFLDSRANHRELIRIRTDTGCVIERLLEASVHFSARLDCRALAMSCEDSRFGRRASQPRTAVKENQAIEAAEEESVLERSERRSAVVMPMLRSRRWTRSRWAARAGIGKNSVYEYLKGARNLSPENRQALAEELALEVLEDLAAWPLMTVDYAAIQVAAELAGQAQLSFWDALVVVAAKRSGAEVLYTEDLNDGQEILGVLIRNPFVAPNPR